MHSTSVNVLISHARFENSLHISDTKSINEIVRRERVSQGKKNYDATSMAIFHGSIPPQRIKVLRILAGGLCEGVVGVSLVHLSSSNVDGVETARESIGRALGPRAL